MLHLDKQAQQKEPECRGQIYRYTESQWISDRGDWHHTERMVHQKRLSCPGCQHCGWVTDSLGEDCTSSGGYVPRIDASRFPGNYFRISTENLGHDPETGCLDQWDVWFQSIRDPRPGKPDGDPPQEKA